MGVGERGMQAQIERLRRRHSLCLPYPLTLCFFVFAWEAQICLLKRLKQRLNEGELQSPLLACLQTSFSFLHRQIKGCSTWLAPQKTDILFSHTKDGCLKIQPPKESFAPNHFASRAPTHLIPFTPGKTPCLGLLYWYLFCLLSGQVHSIFT